jgi:uncharacterized repeat protein (TIGR01451 family)
MSRNRFQPETYPKGARRALAYRRSVPAIEPLERRKLLAPLVTFFGLDRSTDEDFRLDTHLRADAAQTAFLNRLVASERNISDVATFASPPRLTTASSGNLTASFRLPGGQTDTATFEPSPEAPEPFQLFVFGEPFDRDLPPGFPPTDNETYNGRFSINRTDNYVEAEGAFTIRFSSPQAAFGFYGTDIGDQNITSLGLTLSNETTHTSREVTLPVNLVALRSPGSVLYFGLVDTDNPFTSITFHPTTFSVFDDFGFDNFIIAQPQQVNPGPVPGLSIVKLTNGTDNNVKPGVFVPVGSTVTFTYLVANTGTVPLSAVVVRDDRGTPDITTDDFRPTFVSGDTNGNGLLDTTETWTYTASRIATAGQYTNIGTVSGTDPSGVTTTATDPDNHFGSVPSLNLVKLTNGTNNNIAPGPIVPVGSTVAFTYLVANTGNVPLSGVTVRDDNGTPGNTADDFNATFLDGDTNANGLLDTTETWTYIASRMATAGQYTNLGTAAGAPPVGPPVTASDPDNHFGSPGNNIPGINLIKRTNGTDNNTAPGPLVPIGSTVTFTYVVTNNGNVPLSAVTVTDDRGLVPAFQGGDTDNDGLLDTTETWTYTASALATPGQYTNLGTAAGTAPPGDGRTVTATDPDNHFGSDPRIRIIKRTNGTDNNAAPGPLVPVGSTVTFTYLVANTGNVPLSNIAVTDDRGLTPVFQGGDANGNGLLDTTEAWTYVATTAAAAGQYTNLGTAAGTAPTGDGRTVTATDPDNHFGVLPSISIVKRTNGTDNNIAPGPIVPVGSMVTYDRGLIPAFQGGDGDANGLLDVGETWTYTASTLATPGQYTNLGTASGSDPFGATVTASDPDNHFGSGPRIRIIKRTNGTDNNTAPGPLVPFGSTVSY